MAYGQFVDYQALPRPGAYSFGTKDGRRLVVTGDPAEQLKRRLDASAALAPQPVAGPGTGEANMSVAPEEPAMSVAPPPAPPAPAPAPPADPRTGTWEEPPGPTRSAAAEPGTPSPQAPPRADPTMRSINGQLYQWTHNANGRPQYTRVIGKDASGNVQYDARDVFEERSATRGSKGGIVERSRTIQGGFPVDEEIEAQRAENYRRQVESQELGAQAAREDAAATRGFLEQQQREVATDQAEAEARNRLIQQRVDNLQSKYESMQAAYQSSKVDQNRILKGEKGVIMGLAAGLGAFGAALARTPNYALDTINRMQDMDVRQQEAERAIKGEGANNALRDLERELGSLDLAKTALKALKSNAAKLQFEAIAANTSDVRIRANAQKLAAELEKQELDRKEQLRRDSLGLVTRAFVNVPGSAGSPGGLTRPERGAAPGLSEVPKTDAANKPTERQQILSGGLAAIDQSIANLDTYKDEEIAWSPESENVLRRAGRAVVNKIGGEGTYEATIPEEKRDQARRVNDAKETMINVLSVAQGQGAVNNDQFHRISEKVSAAKTVGEVRRALLDAREQIEASQKAIQATKK